MLTLIKKVLSPRWKVRKESFFSFKNPSDAKLRVESNSSYSREVFIIWFFRWAYILSFKKRYVGKKIYITDCGFFPGKNLEIRFKNSVLNISWNKYLDWDFTKGKEWFLLFTFPIKISWETYDYMSTNYG